MKIFTFLFAFFALSLCCFGDTTVSGTQDGRALDVSGEQAPRIEKFATALLVSCGYEAPASMATEDRWKQGLKASHIHLVFSEPRKFSFRFSTTGPSKVQEVTVEEVLIPISLESAPDYVLVRSHDHIRAFAKYDDREAIDGLRKMLPPQPER